MEHADLLRASRSFAASQLRMGKPPRQIEDALVQRGLEREEARGIIRSSMQGVAQNQATVSEWAGRNMMIGGVVCLIGCGVTFGTYQAAASNPEGGHYVMAWGAIVFGAAQFLGGLVQMAKNRR